MTRRAGGRIGDRLTGRTAIAAVGAVALGAGLVLALVVLGPGRLDGPTARRSIAPVPFASADIATSAPALLIIDAATGQLAGSVAARSPGQRGVFAAGSFWQLETEPGGIARIDPATSTVAQTIDLPVRDPGGFVIDGTTILIADRGLPRVVRVDTLSGTEIPELRVTADRGDVRGAHDVVAAGGSVWIARSDPGEVVQMDPGTGRVLRNLRVAGASVLAADDDRIWVLSADGHLTAIDAGSGEPLDISLRLPADSYESLAVGAGSVWTAGRRNGTVYRVTRSGQLDRSFETGAGALSVSFADGTLWVGNQQAGSVSAIDALTGQARRIGTGHEVVGVVAGAGRVLVGVIPRRDPFAGLEGRTLSMAIDGDPLAVFDPPLVVTFEMYAVLDATCAGLLQHRDRPPPEGWELEPEIATGVPSIDETGRTYTFAVRDGFSFFPSGEPVTADVIRASLERALSPDFGPEYPYANFLLGDIKGTSPFAAGLSDRIGGLAADGDRLSITLQAPAQDFLGRLSLPQFCLVPPGIRAVTGGVNPPTGLPGTGPYVLVSKERDSAILRRNPSYPGPRRTQFENIAIRLNQDLRTSIAQVDSGEVDYVLSYRGEALDPRGDLARAYGPGSADRRYFNTPTGELLFLAVHPTDDSTILADASVRRAIAQVLDRPDLAGLLGWLPAGQLLTPRTRGYVERDDPLLRGPDVEAAKSLMAGRTGSARLVYDEGCDTCAALAETIRRDLDSIGIGIQADPDVDPAGESADLSLWFHWYPTTDPVRFLDYLPASGLVLTTRPEDRPLIDRIGFLTGEERIAAAVSLADWWASDQAVMIPLAHGVSREYFSPRVGCQVFPPSIFSADLVNLCPKDG